MLRFTYEVAPTMAGPMFTRPQAASVLGVSMGGIDKLLESGFLGDLKQQAVISLANSPHVRVLDGRLPVLRTAAHRDAILSDHDDRTRKYIGASPTMSDDELLQASNRWWRSNPTDILAAGLLVVAISGFIVAVLQVHSLFRSQPDKKGLLRHAYDASLLCRMDDLADASSKRLCSEGLSPRDRDGCLALLGCRVRTLAGGPIAYVDALEGAGAGRGKSTTVLRARQLNDQAFDRGATATCPRHPRVVRAPSTSPANRAPTSGPTRAAI